MIVCFIIETTLFQICKMVMRSRFTTGFKIKAVQEIGYETSIDNEDAISIRLACWNHKIDPRQYRNWKRDYMKLLAHRRRSYRMHPGRKSSISDEVEEELIEWLVMKREGGNHVNYDMLVTKVGQLDRVFRRKSDNAKKLVIRRLALRNKFVYRVSTHTAQKSPVEVASDALTFVAETIPVLATSFYGRRDKDYIINMDQTPVYFTMGSKSTLEFVGARSVPLIGTPNVGSTSRATVFLTVTASGKFLRNLIVFKGTENGRVSREFTDYDPRALYQAQLKAWCDKRVMVYWVKNVLQPYIEAAPEGVRPVLLLDRYSCHMMDEILEMIGGMCVEIIHIPGGCTSLAQPLDVGVNKPFKDRLRAKWQRFVTFMQEEKDDVNYIPKVPRKMMARWIVKATTKISETIVRNAWLHAPYNYFSVEDDN
jgi:hypothetical protein